MDPRDMEDVEPLADIRLELQLPRADAEEPDGDDDDDMDEEEEEERVVFTVEEWLHAARASLEHSLDQLGRRDDGFLFTIFGTQDLLIMAVFPELRTRFTGMYVERGITEVFFEFEELDGASQWLVHTGLASMEEILMCARQIGLAFGANPRISHLNIGEGTASIVPVASSLVETCRQVGLLVLGFKGRDDVHTGSLLLSLQGHGARELRLCHPTAVHLSALCPVVHTMPSIMRFSLIGSYPDEFEDHPPLVISQPQDAAVLQSVLSINSLKELVLHHFICDTIEAATIFCQGIATSQLKSIEMSGADFPEGSDEMLVNALAAAPLESLEFSSSNADRDNTYKTLCRGLKESTTIKSLTLGEWGEGTFIDSDELVEFMSDGLPRTIECLTFHLKNWKKGFAKFISGYAKGETDGPRLRKLVVIFDDDFEGPETAPKEFVAAVDEGARCLEEVVVKRSRVGNITDTWCTDELQSVLALNRQRGLHGHLFERIEQGASLAIRKALLKDALDAIDEVTFYGFLRRDEWRLQALVKELAAE